MTENITIIDNFNITDKISSGQPRKKNKMIHEQLFEQYQIDQEKIFERTGLLKTIPPEWIPEIILLNVETCKTPRNYQNVNIKNRMIVIGFETVEHCKAFYGDSGSAVGEFNNNMNKAINNYLTKKGLDPKQYNRIISTESSSDGLQVIVRY